MRLVNNWLTLFVFKKSQFATRPAHTDCSHISLSHLCSHSLFAPLSLSHLCSHTACSHRSHCHTCVLTQTVHTALIVTPVFSHRLFAPLSLSHLCSHTDCLHLSHCFANIWQLHIGQMFGETICHLLIIFIYRE